MIDIHRIRENPEGVRQALLKRMDAVDFSELLEWDEESRRLKGHCDGLRGRRNQAAKEIGALKKKGEDAEDKIRENTELREEIAAAETQLKELDERIQDFLAGIPNTPDDDVPAGGKENNIFLRAWGEKPDLAADAKDHVELCTSLGLVDYERGAKLGGSGYWIYQGIGARLEWALLNYFIDTHLADGYAFILPPHILTEQCGYVAGQFPKFKDDVFHLRQQGDGPGHFLLPTSETAIINLHAGEILDAARLPLKYFAYTPCYRREAGSYRTEERGMIRGHQFNKVEMFQFTAPENSDAALEELLGKAEALVQGLGLHYQVSQLAAGDCGAAMAKTLDIEVWIPSMDEYKEVSSASNARDYQARRGNIRFKEKGEKKTRFIHSLNASGLATSRLIPAIVEQHQQPDGAVIVPEALRHWTGADRLEPIS